MSNALNSTALRSACRSPREFLTASTLARLEELTLEDWPFYDQVSRRLEANAASSIQGTCV